MRSGRAAAMIHHQIFVDCTFTIPAASSGNGVRTVLTHHTTSVIPLWTAGTIGGRC